MIEFRRSACPTMMRRKRCAPPGRPARRPRSVSTKPLIEVTGVLSSCETLATKSRRTVSSRLSRVTSLSTTTAPTSSPLGVAGSSVPLACRLRSSAPTRMTMSASTGRCPPSVCATTCCRSGLRTTSWMDLPSAAAGSVSSRRGGGGVDGDDALVGVDGEHALDHAREHRLALVALVGERAQLVVELVGHVVDALGHGGELLDARHEQLVGEVAGGEALGAGLDLRASAPLMRRET